MKRRIIITSLSLLILIGITACADPYGVYHKVQKEENIERLSIMYEVDVDKLRDVNNISGDTDVQPGDYIWIPGVKAPMTWESAGSEVHSKEKKIKADREKKPDARKTETGKAALRKTHTDKSGKPEPGPASCVLAFRWPLSGIVTSPYGVRDGSMHEGIDISVPEGTAIAASADGTVIFSQDHGGYGNVVIIQHTDNYFSVYAHNSKNIAKEGQKVKAGEKIALSGKTGKASGPHLHFEIRIGSKPIDPQKCLSRAPVAQLDRAEDS